MSSAQPQARPGTSLTPRELQVIRLAARGYSKPEIAHRLGNAEGTVRNLAANAYARLGVGTLVEALSALGWLKVPS